ncbi:MAG: hypothetical protein BYD32DRAFT_421212 [Podila humilis]|nr:MAG: hypothetical protein BYD32DRAFT_421212 [Podila humilis]
MCFSKVERAAAGRPNRRSNIAMNRVATISDQSYILCTFSMSIFTPMSLYTSVPARSYSMNIHDLFGVPLHSLSLGLLISLLLLI